MTSMLFLLFILFQKQKARRSEWGPLGDNNLTISAYGANDMLNQTRNAYRNMSFRITQNNIASHLNSDIKQGSEYNLVLLTRVGRL